MDGAAVIPVCYHKCGDNWVLVRPGSLGDVTWSQPESPATGVSVLARWLSLSCLLYSDQHWPLSCTGSLLGTAATPGRKEAECQLSEAGQSSWPLYCTVLCTALTYSALQSGLDRPHLYLACSTRLLVLHSSDCERNSCDEKHLKVPSVDYLCSIFSPRHHSSAPWLSCVMTIVITVSCL